MKETQKTMTAQQKANKKQNEKRQQQEKIPSIVMDPEFAELVNELTKIHGSKSAVVREAIYQFSRVRHTKFEFKETEKMYVCITNKLNYFAIKPHGQLLCTASNEEYIVNHEENLTFEDPNKIENEYSVVDFDDFKEKVREMAKMIN